MKITHKINLVWTKEAWQTAQNFTSGRAFRSNTVSFESRLNHQNNVFLARIPIPSSKYVLVCPLPWEKNHPDNYEQTIANIVSLHHMTRQVYGRTVNTIKQSMFLLIEQKLAAVLAPGAQSWTAPILETSRHMVSWTALTIAAVQTAPTLRSGNILKWLGSIRFLHLAEPHSHQLIEIADDETNYLQYHQDGYSVNIDNYGQAIKKYNTIAAYDTWKNAAHQNPFRENYASDGKHNV